MGSINNVYVYKCDTCLRTVERFSDGKHPDPVRCVITNKCRGLLSLVDKRTGKPRLTPPIVGLDDRIPRGTTPDQTAKAPTVPPAQIGSFVNGSGITLAGLQRSIGAMTSFFVTDTSGDPFILEQRGATARNPISSVITAVLYEVTPSVLEYRHYMFSFHGSASVVLGQDDTPERNLLRFNSSSSVRVYANGIELVNTVDYDRSVDDQITLTPMLIDSSIIIDIYVYKGIITEFDENTAVRLDFEALSITSAVGLASRGQCAWGNVTALKTADDVERLPLFAPSLAVLDTNKSYGIQRFEATSAVNGLTQTILASSLTFLLASPPYSFFDKRTNRYLSGTAFTNNAVISFKPNEATGELEPTVDENYITQVFEPLVITSRTTNVTNTASSETTQKKTLLPPRKYVIGPS